MVCTVYSTRTLSRYYSFFFLFVFAIICRRCQPQDRSPKVVVVTVQFYVLPHTRQSGETMTFVSAGHILLTVTPTQPVGSGRSQRGSNPGPPHQESRALSTERSTPSHVLLKLKKKNILSIARVSACVGTGRIDRFSPRVPGLAWQQMVCPGRPQSTYAHTDTGTVQPEGCKHGEWIGRT